MKLSAAIDDYAQCARYELGHSKSTFYCYSARLKQFLLWLEQQGHTNPTVQEVSYELIRRYYFSVVNQGVRPRTQRSHLHAIRALLGYLVSQGALQENAADKIRMPKLDATNRKLVSDEELQSLLAAADRQASDYRCVRDKAVLSVLIFCALRRQELLDLKLEDLNLEEKVLIVQCGKGSKSRQVPLCKEACQFLREWVSLRSTLKAKTGKLFTIPGGRPLGDDALTRLVNEIAAIAGLKGDDRIKPHSVRHAAATRLLRNGMDIRSVSVWLGHSDTRTTLIYLHSSEQHLRTQGELASFQRSPEAHTEPPAKEKTPERSAFFQARRRAIR